MFGDKLIGSEVSPDFSVALGGAALALKLSNAQENKVVDKSFKAIPAPAIKHRDVTPHSLGVAVQDLGSRADLCSVILERQTPTPCTATKMYGSMKDEQTKFLVQILQGE